MTWNNNAKSQVFKNLHYAKVSRFAKDVYLNTAANLMVRAYLNED